MGFPIADIIVGVIGGGGQVAATFADRSQAQKDKAYQMEEQAGLNKLLAKTQIEAVKKQQNAQLASTVISAVQANELAHQQEKSKQVLMIVMISIAGVIVLGGAAVFIISRRKSAAAVNTPMPR